MTIAPASKIKNDSLAFTVFYIAFGILMFAMLYSKCSGDNYNVQRGARMGLGAIDTVAKPNPPVEKKIPVVYSMKEWQGKFDTLNYINQIIGKSMLVDDADKLRAAMGTILGGFAKQITDTSKSH